MHETARDPLPLFREANVELTRRLAKAAREVGVPRFVLVSSVKVNGEETGSRPFAADDSPGYCDPYGQSKWEAEQILQDICEAGKTEWVVVRPPLVYGPEVRANFFNLMHAVYRGLPLPLGGLQNRRSLVSLHNLCSLLMCVAEAPAAANQRFMVSDDEDVSTPELVRALAVAMRRPARLFTIPRSLLELVGSLTGRKAAVQRLYSSLAVDLAKTKEILGWRPPFTLAEGLQPTVEWYLSNCRAR
jgi:UDP-glucose 4-epimerase